jgi:opacity protein-like surface antigen
MIQKTLASLALACLCAAASAQTITPAQPKVRYVGLQANQLLRQLFSFGNSTAVNNPYLLTFSVNRDSVGPGLNLGIGYTFDEVKTGDAVFERVTKLNTLAFRIGYDYKYALSRKFITSAGIDFLVRRSSSDSEVTSNDQFNKSKINSNNKDTGFGFGPRATLNYHLTDRLLIGTEATWYFTSSKNTSKVVSKFTTTEFDPITGQQIKVNHTETTESDDDLKKLEFNVPAVIYLILRF